MNSAGHGIRKNAGQSGACAGSPRARFLALALAVAMTLLLPCPGHGAENRATTLLDSIMQAPGKTGQPAAPVRQNGPAAPVAPVVKPLGPKGGPEGGAEKPLRDVVRERQQQGQGQNAGKARPVARDLNFALTHDGVKRTALVHVPPQAAGKGARKLPLVIFLHGAGGSAAQGMRQTNLTGLADRAGFLAVFPEGLGPEGGQTWNAWMCCGFARDTKVDDVGFLDALIARLRADGFSGPLIDGKRIYLTGFSNGAMLASRFALERPGVAAAIAVVSGTLPCDLDPPKAALPVLIVHGDQDKVARYAPTPAHPATGRSCEDYPARAQVDYWVRGLGLPGKPRVLEHTKTHSRMEIYEGGKKGRAELRYLVVHGGGHAWPGGAREVYKYCDMPPREPDVTALVWEFLSRHSLGAASQVEKAEPEQAPAKKSKKKR